MNTKIPKIRIEICLLLFPYLSPLGLNSIKGLKIIILSWMMASMVVTILLWIQNPRFNLFTGVGIVYFLYIIIVTIAETGGIGEGLRKMFGAPCLFLLVDYWMRVNKNELLKVMLHIAFIEELLNLILWNVKIFSGDQYLLGIRTYFPLFGVFGIYIALLCMEFGIGGTKRIGMLTIAMATLSNFITWSSTGVVAIVIIMGMLFLVKHEKLERIVDICDCKKLIPIGIALNVGVVFFNIQYYFSFIISNILGESLLLNGRSIIWDSAIKLIKERLIFGYGVYGVYIPMPDWWGTSYNYAHNQILQFLLDGGLIAAILFGLLIAIAGRNIDACGNPKLGKMSATVMFSCLLMMISEAYSNYLVFYALIALLGECCDEYNRGGIVR